MSRFFSGLWGSTSTAAPGGQRDPRSGNPSTIHQGPPRGLLAWLRDVVHGWPGPSLARKHEAGEIVQREKVRSGPSGVIIPWFLPYFDDQTGETSTMRIAYRRMVADPNVKAAFLSKIFGVASLDLRILPANKRSKKDKRVAEHTEWNLTERIAGGFPELCWSVLSGGLIDGHSVCEKVWDYEEGGKYSGKYALACLKPKDTEKDLVLQVDQYRNVVGIQGMRYNSGSTFAPANFTLFRYLPLYGAPSGTSDFRAVYSRYWLLDTVLKLRAMGLEKRAMPILLGHYSNTNVKPSLETALADAKSQNWISVPEDARVEALDIAGRGDDMFSSAVRDLKEEIFLGILGATLQSLTGGQGQMRGNSMTHADTADLFRWFLSQALVALLNDRTSGLIKDIVDLNYAVRDYPRAVLSSVNVEELLKDLQIDGQLHAWGLDLSKDEVYERYGRKPPQGGKDTLAGQQSQGGAPGADPGGGGGAPGGLPFGEDTINPHTVPMKRLAESEEGSATTPFRGFSEAWRAYAEGQQRRRG